MISLFYSRLPVVSRGIFRSCMYNHYEILNSRSYTQFCVYISSVSERQKICAPFILTYRYMAGHAKWQNIKHIKAEKDKEKNLLCNKYVRLVLYAVRDGGPDAEKNNRLATVLEEAKKKNVPFATLQNAMNRVGSKKLQSGTIEMLGPGGCIIVMDYQSDNICEMRRMLKIICKKHSIGIFPGNSARWRSVYEQKGIIKVTKQLGNILLSPDDSEKMLETAIEAGAEDVQLSEEESDDDNKIDYVYQFICAPDDIMIVKKELEKNFVIDDAFVGYLPIAIVTLSEADRATMLEFISELENLPEHPRLYINIA